MGRAEVQLDELLRLPFPLPDQLENSDESWGIVKEASYPIQQAKETAQHSPRRGKRLSESIRKVWNSWSTGNFDLDAVDLTSITDNDHSHYSQCKTYPKEEGHTDAHSQQREFEKGLCGIAV